jgi:hypothetical protein
MKKHPFKIVLTASLFLGSILISPIFAFASAPPPSGGCYAVSGFGTVGVDGTYADTGILGPSTYNFYANPLGTYALGYNGSYWELNSYAAGSWVAPYYNNISSGVDPSTAGWVVNGFGSSPAGTVVDTSCSPPPPPPPPTTVTPDYYLASSTCATTGTQTASGGNYNTAATTTCSGYLPIFGGSTTTAPFVNDISDKFNYKDQVLSFGVIVFLLMFPVLIWIGSIFKPRDKVIKFKK